MIAHFADPYPGELLYSAYARLFRRMRYDSPREFMRNICASRYLASLIDLPSHLAYLVAALPPGHRYSTDRLIDEYTLFPWYRPFLSIDRRDQLRQEMLGCTSNAIHARVGLTGNGTLVPMPPTLRFCALCISEDRNNVGEAFWHRVHQVPGVEVCPVHAVFLEYSGVATQCAWYDWKFITTEQISAGTHSRSLDRSNPTHQMLFTLAQDTDWLLQECSTNPGPMQLRQQYLRILLTHKSLSSNGNEMPRILCSLLEQHYGRDVLTLLQCTLKDLARKSWPYRLLFDSNYFSHPLHHLLLIHFLGYSVKEMFNQSLDYQPFGKGPWPCLNPTSKHYKRHIIHECVVMPIRTNPSAVVATFACECGYVYTRSGPDSSCEDCYRYTTVKSYGPIWEAKLRELWLNTRCSLPMIGRELGVGKDTVERHARRLGLPHPRSMHQ
jgi:hypothetical protein